VKRRTRIRLLIYLLLVLAVVAVVVFARRLDVNDRVSKENFDRIADGMTQAEVEGILGSPTAIETFHNKDEGRLVAWQATHTENHWVYLRIISISFDANGRKRGVGNYTNTQYDVDSWLGFKQWVGDLSPWLAQKLP